MMSDDTKPTGRIDPATVPDLFRRLGLTPITSSFGGDLDGKPCGCITTALLMDRLGPDEGRKLAGWAQGKNYDSSITMREIMDRMAGPIGLDPDYASGLAGGWDGSSGKPDSAYLGTKCPAYRAGYEDGYNALMACRAAGIGDLDGDDGDEPTPWGEGGSP